MFFRRFSKKSILCLRCAIRGSPWRRWAWLSPLIKTNLGQSFASSNKEHYNKTRRAKSKRHKALLALDRRQQGWRWRWRRGWECGCGCGWWARGGDVSRPECRVPSPGFRLQMAPTVNASASVIGTAKRHSSVTCAAVLNILWIVNYDHETTDCGNHEWWRVGRELLDLSGDEASDSDKDEDSDSDSVENGDEDVDEDVDEDGHQSQASRWAEELSCFRLCTHIHLERLHRELQRNFRQLFACQLSSFVCLLRPSGPSWCQDVPGCAWMCLDVCAQSAVKVWILRLLYCWPEANIFMFCTFSRASSSSLHTPIYRKDEKDEVVGHLIKPGSQLAANCTETEILGIAGMQSVLPVPGSQLPAAAAAGTPLCPFDSLGMRRFLLPSMSCDRLSRFALELQLALEL